MKFYSPLLLLAILSSLIGCNSSPRKEPSKKNLNNLDLQGHRGCRGLYPENTIAGFLKALDIGVKTLEMDVVITKDSMVLLSHEPWFSHEIALNPDGAPIRKKDEKNHKIFELTYAETQLYDVGLREHKNFPDQRKMAATKPLLIDVIKASDAHAKKKGRPLPFYNIETKCTPEGDNIFHPEPHIFSDLLINVLEEQNVLNRCFIQSFDVRTLQYIHKTYPNVQLVLLIENSDAADANIHKLGFSPQIYSPYFYLVNQELVSFCKKNDMKLIPWTVNEKQDMENMIVLGVDGIITDYPHRFNELKESL